MNLPRPLVTTKAFPEDVLVVSNTLNMAGLNSFAREIIYEQRIGSRNQVELIVPLEWAEQENTDDPGDTQWQSSVGDIGIAGKCVLYGNLDTGAIVSVGGELFFPTGEEEKGSVPEIRFSSPTWPTARFCRRTASLLAGIRSQGNPGAPESQCANPG